MFEEETNFTFDIDENTDINLMAMDFMEEARKHHEQYLMKGSRVELDNAVDSYIDAIKFNPNIAEAYYRLATLLWDKGEINLSSAIEQCKSAINISPSNSNARIYAGFFLEKAKKYDEAEKEFKTAIKLNPFKSARSRLSLASMYIDKMNNTSINAKDFSSSLYYMLSGAVSIPLDYSSMKVLYKNLYKNASLLFFDTIGSFLEKTKNYAMAVKAYDKAATSVGREEIYYQKIADINIRNDEVKTAKDFYVKALETNPYNKDLLFKLATLTQVYFENEVGFTIDCYSKLLELGESNPDIYYQLGHLYLKREDFINAINAFNLALEKDNENPFYHNALAYALVSAEQYEDACEHYRYAIDLNPNPEWTSIVCQTLASIYSNVFDDIDNALEYLRSAIVLDENSDEAFVELGDVYSKTEDVDSAIKSYCEAIKLNPQNAIAYNKCALALWRKDYIEEAIIAYNKAIAINPDYASAYNNLGVIYLDGVRNLKEAERLFKIAISIKSDYVMANFNLARVYEEKGLSVDAAKFYQKAIELNEDNQELDTDEIKEKLHRLFEV